MTVVMRLVAVILALLFAFMLAVDIKVITSDGSIRWGIFIGYLIGTALLAYGAIWFWRRPAHRGAAA